MQLLHDVADPAKVPAAQRTQAVIAVLGAMPPVEHRSQTAWPAELPKNPAEQTTHVVALDADWAKPGRQGVQSEVAVVLL